MAERKWAYCLLSWTWSELVHEKGPLRRFGLDLRGVPTVCVGMLFLWWMNFPEFVYWAIAGYFVLDWYRRGER